MHKTAAIAFAIVAACAAGGALAAKQVRAQSDDVVMALHDAGCPSGFVESAAGCVKRGHARKLVVGQQLPPAASQRSVAHKVLRQLPPLQPGYQYVRIGPDVVLLHPEGIVVNIYANLG